MDTKKKNFFVILLSVVILVVIALLIGLIIQNNRGKTNNVENENPISEEDAFSFPIEKEKETELSLDSSIVKQLEKEYLKIKELNNCNIQFVSQVFSNDIFEYTLLPIESKIAILEKYFDKNYTTVVGNSMKEININDKKIIQGWVMPNDMVEELKENYRVLFGSNQELIWTDSFGTCPIYDYVSGSMIVEDVSSCECKQSIEVESYEYPIKATQSENTIRIYKKVGFEIKEDNLQEKSLAKDALGNDILKSTSDLSFEADTYWKEHQDELNTYVFLYQKDIDGHYYFYAIRKIEDHIS